MARREKGKAAETPKKPAKWSAEAFGEGECEGLTPLVE